MVKKIILIALLIGVSLGCLITNCPRGGKRRDASMLRNSNWLKKYSRCGPRLLGRCFGPNICCGLELGRYIGTPEIHRCRGKGLLTRPCVARFSMCRNNTGRCVANGICCSQGRCYVDSRCRFEEDSDSNESKINSDYSKITVDTDV